MTVFLEKDSRMLTIKNKRIVKTGNKTGIKLMKDFFIKSPFLNSAYKCYIEYLKVFVYIFIITIMLKEKHEIRNCYRC